MFYPYVYYIAKPAIYSIVSEIFIIFYMFAQKLYYF